MEVNGEEKITKGRKEPLGKKITFSDGGQGHGEGKEDKTAGNPGGRPGNKKNLGNPVNETKNFLALPPQVCKAEVNSKRAESLLGKKV